MRKTADKLRERFVKVAELMHYAEDDVFVFMSIPKKRWARLASTITMERLNKEIKRRSRVVGNISSNAPVRRLMGKALAEQTDECQVTLRHISHETMVRALSKEHQANPLAQSEAA